MQTTILMENSELVLELSNTFAVYSTRSVAIRQWQTLTYTPYSLSIVMRIKTTIITSESIIVTLSTDSTEYIMVAL